MTKPQNRDSLEPPNKLDGAEVIMWAFNPQKPFFVMKYSDGTPYKPIHGFAICQYKGENQFYKFSCDLEWNVENDSVSDAIEEAIKTANDLSTEPITWNKKSSSE